MTSVPANAKSHAFTEKKLVDEGRKWFPVLKETAGDWVADNAARLSAALSLYTILSLAPLLVVTIKIVAVVWRNGAKARETMVHQLTSLMGAKAAEAIQPMLDNSGKHGSGIVATIISTALLFFSATGVFMELQDSMNTIWGVKPKPNQGLRNFVKNRLLSLGMVFGIAFMLLVSMFVSTVVTTLSKDLAGEQKVLSFAVDFLLSFGIVTLLFAAIYKFLPDVKILWKHVWAGAIFTSVLFVVGKYGLALYFKYGAPTSAFGAAGSLAAVLLWVYYSSFILFFGAEFTKVWSKRCGRGIVPDDHAVKITEDERAREGIPSKKRMGNALAGRPFNGKKSVSVPVEDMSRAVAAAYIFAMSLIAAALGALYVVGRSHGARSRPAEPAGADVARTDASSWRRATATLH